MPQLSYSGYTFDGWYYDSSYTNKAVAGASISANTTLYAKWTLNTYTVTYVSAYNQPSAVSGLTNLPSSLPQLSYSGYTFDGWYYDSSYTNKAVAGASISANTTLYAKWTKNVVVSESYDHNFTTSNKTSSYYSITGNTSTSKGSVTYNETKLTRALKMESSTNISFTASADGELTLVFGGTTSASGKRVKIDGVTYTVPSSQILTISLAEGSHTITKGDSINLFYISFTISSSSNVEPELITLATPVVSVSSTGLATWVKVANTNNYRVNIDGAEFVTTSTSHQLSDGQTIKVMAIGDDIAYESSSYSSAVKYVAPVIETYTVSYVSQFNQPSAVSGLTKLPSSLPQLSYSGYTFDGWYYDSSYTNKAVAGASISANTTLYAKWTEIVVVETYSISFASQFNEPADITNVTSIPSLPQLSYDGYIFEGWYTDSSYTTLAVVGAILTDDITLYAKWTIIPELPEVEGSIFGSVEVDGQVKVSSVSGLQEAAYIEYSAVSGASNYNIYIQGGKYSSMTLLDTKVAYTQISGSSVRTDLLGLARAEYRIKIVPVINGNESTQTQTVVKVFVDNYDRSGYAHFNYNSGVGAYNNDGTLKSNAIVLYVTDSNKNSVSLSYAGITVTGIGNILNTAGMDNGTGTNSKGGTANTNQDILRILADNNIPLVVRFVGIVSDSGLYKQGTFSASSTPKINGLTHYDSINYGGSEGDNGHMARMRSAKDITLEGVGVGATIDGWGFHFICSTSDRNTGRGTSFEVRNLIFINTPEDAIGMEGTQGILNSDGSVSGASSTSSDILGSVERCWIHDNEFYCPSISSPAESDKSEGDGSVDFKRGQYFTCSYNYFEGCHKTNLVGSSDSSLQFNLTYHHNYWKNCGARGPLARNANIHMYNNIFEGQTDYAMNPRATAYIFSEYNSFYKCKNPQEVAGGALKSYNDNFASCIGTSNGTIVSSKSQAVSNSCKFSYRGIDYSKFELNSSLSYIPGNNYNLQSDFTEIRKEVLANAGALKANQKTKDTISVSEYSIFTKLGVTPISVTAPFEAAPGKISKTVYAFKVNSNFSISASFSGGVLVNEAGEAIMTSSGSLNNLKAGTYAIQPLSFGNSSFSATDFKEVTISSIKITSDGSGFIEEEEPEEIIPDDPVVEEEEDDNNNQTQNPSGSYTLTFASSKPVDSNGFFTVSGNYRDGNKLKLESSAGSIKFTTNGPATVVIVFGTTPSTIKINGVAYTTTSTTTITLSEAGTYEILKGSGSPTVVSVTVSQ